MKAKVIKIKENIIELSVAKNSKPKIDLILKDNKSDTWLKIEYIEGNSIFASIFILESHKSIFINDMYTLDDKNPSIKTISSLQGIGNFYDIRLNNITSQIEGIHDQVVEEELTEPVIFQKEVFNNFDYDKKIQLTGLKVIDLLFPIVEGSKTGIFGGGGVGKTVLIQELLHSTKRISKNFINIYMGIGERNREAIELIDDLKKTGIISNTLGFFGQMSELPAIRSSIIYSGLTTAEIFRKKYRKNVLLFIDNAYRYVQALTELSISLGNKPSFGGYVSSMKKDIANFQKRINMDADGSIGSIQTVYVPSDDFTDEAVFELSSHFESKLLLDRSIASKGRYPAINLTKSSSINLKEDLVGKKHFDIANKTLSTLAKYEQIKEIVEIVGVSQLSENERKLYRIARQLENYFTQNYSSAEIFTGRKGYVSNIENTIKDVERILLGEFSNIPPLYFLYIKTVEDALETFSNKDIVEKNSNSSYRNMSETTFISLKKEYKNDLSDFEKTKEIILDQSNKPKFIKEKSDHKDFKKLYKKIQSIKNKK
ncbi:MAG: hypothetical protein K4H23_04050 [Mollicutes bacterium PWAP]|nr:hypothetical protein [Mollicutes bacterium PWAP]